MLVFCRRELAPPNLPTGRTALLLEGSWDDDALPMRVSLDDEIDFRRFGWIDESAERLAAQTATAATGDDPSSPNFADLNVVRLRYAAVKWLRPAAWLRSLPLDQRPEHVELFADPRLDAEHVAVWHALAAAERFSLAIREIDGGTVLANHPFLPPNPRWRRLLARWLANRPRRPATADTPRVLLCGNPRLLDPVCDELLSRGANVAWLYDRFPVGAWRRRRGSGVTLLTCDTKESVSDRFGERLLQRPVEWNGIDLSQVVEAWYRARRSQLGTHQSRRWRSVDEHMHTFRPTQVVVDEDATPLARMVVEHAGRIGARSFVVQHGVCGVRFGFAPLKADTICAADDGSRRQLRDWGVPDDRIALTGSPARERAVADLLRQRSSGSASVLNVVFLATVPPRDDRPDAVAFHLTTRSYRNMLRGALTTLAAHPNIALSVKPHPRATHEPILQSLLADTPGLRYRVVNTFPAEAALVVSCGSGAGIDAAAAGLPVIQLLPEGSGPMLAAEWYGLCGTARSATEFSALLADVLDATNWIRGPTNRAARPEPQAMGVVNLHRHATPFVGDSGTCHAAARIVDLIFAAAPCRAWHASDSRVVEECLA